MGKKNRNKKAEETVVAVAEQPKTEAVKVCPCGCGTSLGRKRVFEQGHDARIRGWFVKVSGEKKELASLPPVLQKAFPIWESDGAGAFVKTAIVRAQAN